MSLVSFEEEILVAKAVCVQEGGKPSHLILGKLEQAKLGVLAKERFDIHIRFGPVEFLGLAVLKSTRESLLLVAEDFER